ncbi:hypothetical protein QAO71_10420 [Halopseudomonas sp. SMJS2]|uniref:hypothetical protein n=1 Tax=Halopseudomonas sp. SMJS2 TaxID=3041098 RepID=UPI002453227C|nr:hypothetical protein [Halopseudomonas sp. SMJS2]WGK60507.1 hypothetical protein QAO71_10420 [Halopseudomonas sp. SMJS2]
MNPSDFFTRSKANEGEKLPLSLPDGTPTDEWLLIRGVDSDEFQAALDAHRRTILANAAIEDEAERAEKNRQAGLKLHAALIMGWSFEAELTPEALEEFLREAPHLAVEVDHFASNRQRFFRKGSASSVKG